MQKTALITGVTGQDGSYLAEFLLEKGYEVHGLIRRHSISNTGRIEHILQSDYNKVKFFLHFADTTDSSNLMRLIGEIRPTEVNNLAAGFFRNPWITLAVSVLLLGLALGAAALWQKQGHRIRAAADEKMNVS